MARPSDLTPEQRVEVVLSLLRKEEPASVLSRRHGISPNTLSQWREEFIAGGTSNLASGKRQQHSESKRLEELEAAVEERDRVIGEITIANRILKKSRRPTVDEELREEVTAMCTAKPKSRLSRVLHWLGIATSSWYHHRIPKDQLRPRGPEKKAIDPDILGAVKMVAEVFPNVGLQADFCCLSSPRDQGQQ